MIPMPRVVLGLLFLSPVFALTGCGPDNSVTVSPVDDSALHTEEEMEAMADQNAADMQSQ